MTLMDMPTLQHHASDAHRLCPPSNGATAYPNLGRQHSVPPLSSSVLPLGDTDGFDIQHFFSSEEACMPIELQTPPVDPAACNTTKIEGIPSLNNGHTSLQSSGLLNGLQNGLSSESLLSVDVSQEAYNNSCDKDSNHSDADKVKRPMNSFLLFSNQYRGIMHEENKKLPNSEISKLLGQKWKELSLVEKQKFIDAAKIIKEQFDAANPEYKYTKNNKKRAKRRKASDVDSSPCAYSPMASSNSPPISNGRSFNLAGSVLGDPTIAHTGLLHNDSTACLHASAARGHTIGVVGQVPNGHLNGHTNMLGHPSLIGARGQGGGGDVNNQQMPILPPGMQHSRMTSCCGGQAREFQDCRANTQGNNPLLAGYKTPNLMATTTQPMELSQLQPMCSSAPGPMQSSLFSDHGLVAEPCCSLEVSNLEASHLEISQSLGHDADQDPTWKWADQQDVGPVDDMMSTSISDQFITNSDDVNEFLKAIDEVPALPA